MRPEMYLATSRHTCLVALGLFLVPWMSVCLGQGLDALPRAQEVDAADLLLVQVVHRHGEREAIFDFPMAQQPPTVLASALTGFPKEAQLTAKGIEQMYDYGRFMRQRYFKYFEDRNFVSSHRVNVISSATDRTINSAQALIAGLFPPNGTLRQWNTTLGSYWSPFPVYTRPTVNDGLLLNFKDDCPVFSDLRDSIDELPLAQQLESQMKGFIADVVRETNITKYDFFGTSAAIEDAIHYQHSHPELTGIHGSGSLPSWLNDTMANGFKKIADIRMHMIVGGNGDRQRTRFRIGYLLNDLFKRMNATRWNRGDTGLKMVQYSGHDENVAAILAALNLYNYTLQGPNFGIPEFTASIIMELHKNNTVRILLKNDPWHMWAEPVVLMHPQCPVPFCPLEKLYDLLSDVIVTEAQWRKECGLPTSIAATQSLMKSSPEKSYASNDIGLPNALIIAGVVLAFAIIFAALVGLGIFLVRRRKTNKVDLSNYGTTLEFQNTSHVSNGRH